MSDVFIPNTTELTVAEIFGPTVQGEGPNTGRYCSFVRLGRCNLSCVWCDTPYTWDWKGKNGVAYDPATELRKMTVSEVVSAVGEHMTDRVVITGGEPTVQGKALAQLIAVLKVGGHVVEVETNGTRMPVGEPDFWNVSPKLGHAGDPLHLRINIEALRAYADLGAAFKFVCSSAEDLNEVAQLVDEVEIVADQVWIMPEGKTADAVANSMAAIADAAIWFGYNLTGRLHVAIWGDTRGK